MIVECTYIQILVIHVPPIAILVLTTAIANYAKMVILEYPFRRMFIVFLVLPFVGLVFSTPSILMPNAHPVLQAPTNLITLLHLNVVKFVAIR